MFTVFKNVTIIFIAVSEHRLFKTKLSVLKWVSFGTIVGSSIVGGYNDLNFNWIGYSWMLLNCISSAMYGIGMRAVIRKVQFEDFDSVYFNNVIAIPIIFVLSLALEDWGGFLLP